MMVGLYHSYGRRPFLQHFEKMKLQNYSEEKMLERFRTLHDRLKGDELHLVSWFRDQVLHPHETQHTLKESVNTLHACNMRLLATSINQFQPFESLTQLFEEEKSYEQLAQLYLRKNRYFPGFFVFLAQK